jgi:tetratricopeptide (TPR) repeat protein
MKFESAICPSCGGQLQIPDDREFVKCMYCGSEIKVRDVLNIKFVVNIPNLIELGNNMYKVGNFDRAIEAFNKVLEFDAENYEAWLGLGNVYKSLTEDPRQYYLNAQKYAPADLKNKIPHKFKSSLWLIRYDPYRKPQLINQIAKTCNWSLSDVITIVNSTPSILWDNIPFDRDGDAKKLKELIEKYGASIEYRIDVVPQVL